MTVPDLCHGKALLLADVSRVHQLETDLAELACRLADMSVQLRSLVLPAMPWVLGSGSGNHLIADTAELAQMLAESASKLAELGDLVPASCCSSHQAVRAAGRSAGDRVAARQVSLQWSHSTCADMQTGKTNQGHGTLHATQAAADESSFCDDENGSVPAACDLAGMSSHHELLAPATEQLFASLKVYIQQLPQPHSKSHSSSPLIKANSSKTGSSTWKLGGAGDGSANSAKASVAGAAVALADLDKLHSQWRMGCWRYARLQAQLSCVARCSSAQTQLVSTLMQDVADAIKECNTSGKS